MLKVNQIKLKEVNSDFPIHSVPELIAPEDISCLVGCQVVYQKGPIRSNVYNKRNGWRGKITKVYPDSEYNGYFRFDVLFETGVVQDYRIKALGNVVCDDIGLVDGEQHTWDAYIWVTSLHKEGLSYEYDNFDKPADPRLFLVGPEGKPPITECIGEDAAKEKAFKLARKSTSGQAYVVYAPTFSFQREEVPVRMKELK